MKYRLTPDKNGIIVEKKSKGAFKDQEQLEFNFTKTLDQNSSQDDVFNYFKTNYIKEY
jgi:hypothetical protein